MSYKNDSELVIINRYSDASGDAKALLYETYDRLRDLTVGGPSIGGSGLGGFSSLLLKFARTFGNSSFLPTLGSEAINIPGTSFYSPISGGTGLVPGGQSSFGFSPLSQTLGFPGGGAVPVQGASHFHASGFHLSNLSPLHWFSSLGIGSKQAASATEGFSGIGDAQGLPPGILAGGASGLSNAATGVGLAAGTAAGSGFGRNFVMPAAALVSGVGGIMTTLGPFFGPWGLAAAAGGSILNGAGGAVLSSFQRVGNQVLSNADVILSNKIKNLETTVKMLDAQQDVLKKLLKESIDGDKKALDNI